MPVAATPVTKAALALVDRTTALLGLTVDVDDLKLSTVAYEHQISELVTEDDETAAYVGHLEAAHDTDEVAVSSADALVAEVERFLHDRRGNRTRLPAPHVTEISQEYVLNRDHVAAPAVMLLASLHGELANRIRAVVEEWPIPPKLVGLFGSAAHHDGDARSDIDVLVVTDDPDLDDRVDDLAELIRRWTGNRAQVVGRTPADVARLVRAKEPIVSEWTRDLVIVGERTALGKAA